MRNHTDRFLKLKLGLNYKINRNTQVITHKLNRTLDRKQKMNGHQTHSYQLFTRDCNFFNSRNFKNKKYSVVSFKNW